MSSDSTPGFHGGERELQERFDSVRLADRVAQLTHHAEFTDDDRRFIEERDMLFLATVDADGNPDCSYKGGEPGFARVIGPRTMVFPSYDGNGKFQSSGNVRSAGKAGLLFIDWEGQRRMRVNGRAEVAFDHPLMAEFPEAQFLYVIEAEEIFPNCPRYIHRMALVERSAFVPRAGCETPEPEWKRHFADDLPADQRARMAANETEQRP